MSGRSTRARRRIEPQRISRRCITLKVCHLTKDDALTAAELQMLDGKVRPGCHVVPYQCPDCGYWHVRNKQIVPVPASMRRSRHVRPSS